MRRIDVRSFSGAPIGSNYAFDSAFFVLVVKLRRSRDAPGERPISVSAGHASSMYLRRFPFAFGAGSVAITSNPRARYCAAQLAPITPVPTMAIRCIGLSNYIVLRLVLNGATSSRLKPLRCLLNYRSTRSITVVSTVGSLDRLEVRFFPVLDESVGFSSLSHCERLISERTQPVESASRKRQRNQEHSVKYDFLR